MDGDETDDTPDGPAPELIIDIDPPIEMKGAKYDQIKLREPKAGEVRQAEAHMARAVNVETVRRYGIALVGRVSGIPEAVLAEVPISKLNQATDYLQSFIDGGQKTT